MGLFRMSTSQACVRVALVVSILSLCGMAAGGCASSSLSSAPAASAAALPAKCNVANVHAVEPGLLVRGAQPDAAGFRSLQQNYGIRTVVNLNDGTAATEA